MKAMEDLQDIPISDPASVLLGLLLESRKRFLSEGPSAARLNAATRRRADAYFAMGQASLGCLLGRFTGSF